MRQEAIGMVRITLATTIIANSFAKNETPCNTHFSGGLKFSFGMEQQKLSLLFCDSPATLFTLGVFISAFMCVHVAVFVLPSRL